MGWFGSAVGLGTLFREGLVCISNRTRDMGLQRVWFRSAVGQETWFRDGLV